MTCWSLSPAGTGCGPCRSRRFSYLEVGELGLVGTLHFGGKRARKSLGILILARYFLASLFIPSNPQLEQLMKKLLCLIAILAVVSPCFA
jgi:hypothetical protein